MIRSQSATPTMAPGMIHQPDGRRDGRISDSRRIKASVILGSNVVTGVPPMDVNGLLETANAAVGFISGGTDLVDKLRKLTQRGDKDSISAAEVAELTLNLQNQLIDARLAQIRLLDALRDLKGEMIEIDRRFELQRRYEPVMTAAGAPVLALKSDDDRAEPPHYICPSCADQGRRTFLQPQGIGKRCTVCNTFFPFEATETRAVTVPTRKAWIDLE